MNCASKKVVLIRVFVVIACIDIASAQITPIDLTSIPLTDTLVLKNQRNTHVEIEARLPSDANTR